MNKIFFALLFIIFITSSCSNKVKNTHNTVSVAAAANLRYALEDINQAFEKKTGIKVRMSVGSSGKLTAQIKNGAPFEIFISANKKYADYLYNNNLILKEAEKICSGILVLWFAESIKLRQDLKNICSLNIRTVAVANPQNAPFGKAAIQVLDALNINRCLQQKIIFTENVAQISQYLLNNNAEIGFTGKSIVLKTPLKTYGKWIEIPDTLYKPIDEYAVLTNYAKNNHLAKKYYQFLLSDQARTILKNNGYKVL